MGHPSRVTRAERWLKAKEDGSVGGFLVDLLNCDKVAGGSVVSSALAFRLFLFFPPFLLVLAGILSIISGRHRIDPGAIGVTGALGNQMSNAIHQSGYGPWVIVAIGIVGMLWTGRSLSRVLIACSCASWQISGLRRTRVREVGTIAGFFSGLALVAVILNKVQADLGAPVAVASLLVAFVVYSLVWFGVTALLPRRPEDPGVLLPGALFVGFTMAALEGISQFYLPDRLNHANRLYGSIGAAIAILGWFFILARAITISFDLNAVVAERYGSISEVLFALPLLRSIPRRSARLSAYFSLEEKDGGSPSAD